MTASTHSLEAFNTATASANKIHDDAVAREYGFRGGLVPGADVYAYLTWGPVERWGLDWLQRGTMRARFVQPVYDGERVTITATARDDALHVAVTNASAATCATATAALGAPDGARSLPGRAPLPAVRPPASAESLRAGTVLGSLMERFDAGLAPGYLADVRETLPIYAERRCAHPGWLLRFANAILARNVELGPWIHVESDVRLHGVVTPGQTIEVQGVVLDERERKGHRFVTLDVAVLADGAVVERVTHTAIHTPRRR